MSYIERIYQGILEAMSFTNYDRMVGISPEQEEQIKERISAFTEEASDLLEEANLNEAKIGNLIHFEAEGHGTGFWDEFDSSTDLGDRLSEIARKHFSWETYSWDDATDDEEVEVMIHENA